MDSNMMADGVISLDDRPAIAAIDRTNKALDGHEQKARTILDRTGKQWTVYGDGLVRVTDKGKSSLDNLVKSMERQAALAGKSGMDRQIAELDLAAKKWGDNDRAIQAIIRTKEKLIAVDRQAQEAAKAAEAAEAAKQSQAKMMSMIQSAPGVIQNPMGAVTGLLGNIGPIGIGVTALVGALTAVEAAGLAATRSLAEYGVEVRDVELRTGLAAKEVGQFSFAAKVVGKDIEVYERAMRGLTTATEDQSSAGDKAREAMSKLGVHITNDVTGAVLPTKTLIVSLSEELSKIPDVMERNKVGMDIFKKQWLEIGPAILEAAENIKLAESEGFGPKEEDIKKYLEYNKELKVADALWSKIGREVNKGLAGTIWIDIKATGAKWILGWLGTGGEPQKGGAIPGLGGTNPIQLGDDPSKITGVKPFSFPWLSTDRSRADDLIHSREGGTLDDQLKKAEKALNGLSAPIAGVTAEADTKAYYSAKDKVDHLKAMIEGTKQLGEEERKLRSFEKSMNERDLTPVEKIWAQRDDLGFKPGSAHYNAATDAALRGVGKELDKEQDKVNKQLTATFDKASPVGLYNKAVTEEVKELDVHTKHLVKQFTENVRAIQDAARVADKYTIDTNAVNLRHQGRMAQISGGGDEVQQLTQELSTRKAIRDMEMGIKEDHRWLYDIDAERHKNELENLKDRYELEEKIAEYRIKQDEQHEQQIRQSVEPLVHTLFTKPSQFGKQFGGQMKDLAMKPFEDMMTDAVTSVLKPAIFGSSKQDPLKVSTDINNLVTQQNTAAVQNLNATLATGPRFTAGGRSYSGGTDGSAAMPWGGPATFGTGGGVSYSGAGMPWSGGAGMASDGLPMSDIRTIAPDLGSWSGGRSAGGGGNAAGGFASLFKSFGTASKGFNLKSMLSGIKSTDWGGLTRSTDAGVPQFDTNGDYLGDTIGKTHITGVNGVAGQVMSAGGMTLAEHGLLGSARGTWGGVAEGAAGGAAMGFQQGGPIGAAIGGGIGLLTGLGEKLAGVETPVNEAKRLVKQQYGISIDTAMANQIVSIAQQKYASHVSIAVRDPDVRKMLMLYAQGTGQKFPMSASTPESGSLAEVGGKLYQQATYQGTNGTPYTFQSNLPVLGGFNGGTYASPGTPNTAGGGGPTYLSVNVDGNGLAPFMTGQYVNPQFVSDQYSAAQNASMNRTQQAANIKLPGLTVG